MKKFLSLVLALVMTMSLVTVSAGAKDFTDNDTITYSEAVNVMSEVGVIDGYTDGSFQPTTNLTRGAAAKIICNLILGPTTAAALGADTAPYSDVPTTNVFAGYIAYCQKEGIISGYADGTFKPSAPLTGYAFMKMLLGALGYESAREGYTGANWSVNVAKQAINIGLNKGNDEFSGQAYVNREEAMLYAFNTLQATMVEYEQNTSIVVNGDTQVTVQTPAQDKAWGTGTLNDGHIKADGYVQFAEEYFPKLEKKDDTDAFERPAHTWSLDGKEIGTYVNYDEMVAEYTTGVSGKEVYDVLSATTIRDCEFYSYLDGAEGNVAKAALARSNSEDLADTDNGVLTQVFLDNDDKEIVITSINTWLAQANASYSESKEYAPLTVYTGIQADRLTTASYNVDVEDVPEVVDVENEGFYLVNISYKDNTRGEVVAIQDVEIMEDSTVTKWSSDDELVVSKLTTGGTEYKAAAKAFYDADTLEDYNLSLLTDMSYNVFVDQYGYVIGVSLYEGALKYVFITGYDMNTSNLSVKTATAAAIFLDGSMEEIQVNVTDTNKKILEDEDGDPIDPYYVDWEAGGQDGNPVLNRWYTYSVNENGVYTLKPASMIATKYDQDAEVVIDTANVSIKADNDTVAADSTRVYGEDESVFVTVDLGKVYDGDDDAITDVTGTYTGVQNVDLEIDTTEATVTTAGVEAQVYAVYDKNNYIIGAIVLGDATGSVVNYAYIVDDTAKNEYIDSDGVYYWDFDAIMNGELVTLTAKSKYGDVLDGDLIENAVQELRMDADGYVVKVIAPEDYYEYAQAIDEDEDITDYNVYYVDSNDDVNDELVLSLQGRTMYITPEQDDMGLALASDAKAVVIQVENGKTVKSEFNSVSAAISYLADPDDETSAKEYVGTIAAVLNSNGTAAWVVFNSETELVTGTNRPVQDDDTTSTGKTTITVAENSDAAFRARDVVTYIDGAGNLKIALPLAGDGNTALVSADVTVKINGINAVVTSENADEDDLDIIGDQVIYTVSGRNMLDTDNVAITIDDCEYASTIATITAATAAEGTDTDSGMTVTEAAVIAGKTITVTEEGGNDTDTIEVTLTPAAGATVTGGNVVTLTNTDGTWDSQNVVVTAADGRTTATYTVSVAE